MKVYGLKAAVKAGTRPMRYADDGSATGDFGVIRLVTNAGEMLTVQWYQVPPLHPIFGESRWFDLRGPGGDGMEFDPATDRWYAPEFVEALYLRTLSDREDYVCPTLHRPAPIVRATDGEVAAWRARQDRIRRTGGEMCR